MEIMSTLKDTWWQYAAAVIAVVLAVVVARNLGEPATGPWWKHFFGTIALGGAPLVIAGGLVVRRRRRRVGSLMLAVGVMPGVAALVLFWWPPFLLFGLFSLAVMVSALIDADKHPVTVPAPLQDTKG
jgi:MYXO-CTERM domain-containing protein